MAVKVEKTFEVPEPVEKVWAILSDPHKVVKCVPGARIIEQVDERNYKGAISVKVGPSVSDFQGTIEIVRSDPDAHEIEILGKGQDVRGKGSASMKMTGKLRTVENGTEVYSVSEMNVVGIFAQMGGRMISEVSNIMFEQFTNCFRRELQSEVEGEAETEEASPKPIKAVGLAISALRASLRRSKKPDSEAAKTDEEGSEPEKTDPEKPDREGPDRAKTDTDDSDPEKTDQEKK